MPETPNILMDEQIKTIECNNEDKYYRFNDSIYKKSSAEVKKAMISLSNSINKAFNNKKMMKSNSPPSSKKLANPDTIKDSTETMESLSTNKGFLNSAKNLEENNTGIKIIASNEINSNQEEALSKNITNNTLPNEISPNPIPQSPLPEEEQNKSPSELDLIFIRAHKNQKQFHSQGELKKLAAVSSEVNMELSNLNLPSLIFNQNTKIYYLNNKPQVTQEFNKHTKQLNFMAEPDFTGIITIQRIDEYNNLITDSYDILRYQEGKLIDIIVTHPAPTKEKCRIYDIALQFFKEHENVENLDDSNIYKRNNLSSASAKTQTPPAPKIISPEKFKNKSNHVQTAQQDKGNGQISTIS